MSGLVGVQSNSPAIFEKSGKAVIHVSETGHIDRPRLTGSGGKQTYFRSLSYRDCNGPLAIWRKPAGTSFSQSDRQCTVEPEQRDNVPGAGGFAGVFKQYGFVVAGYIVSSVPVVP